MNTRSWNSRAMAVVVAGATAIAGALPASAAPVLTNTAAVKQALPGDVLDVRWRGGGGAFFGGLLAGGLIGAAFARPYYYGGYPYGYGYGYGYAPYAYGYSYPYYSSYGYGYPYGGGYYGGGYYGGGYYGGGYGGWRGYGLRGYGWRGAHVGHFARGRYR
jgi:hypothetical protein